MKPVRTKIEPFHVRHAGVQKPVLSLRASSSGRSGGGAGKGRRACNYVSGIWILLTELSDFRQFEWSRNDGECKQTLKNTWKHHPRVMTSLLRQSPFRIDFFDADIQIPETWLQALLSFPNPPLGRLGELARRLTLLWDLNYFLMWTLSFVAINVHCCRPHEWKRFLRRFCVQTS